LRSVAQWVAFPLVVVGMNSIAFYMMGQLLRPWVQKMIHIHFGGLLESTLGVATLADDMYGRLFNPTAAFVVFWLIALWMYRQKLFVRV
jgi:predicted acyltransferase